MHSLEHLWVLFSTETLIINMIPSIFDPGSTYSIWKVTDLDATSVSLFLFGSAHDELWQRAPGTMVALLSPKVRNERDLTLTALQAEQIWVLGTSTDFGFCKALTKVVWVVGLGVLCVLVAERYAGCSELTEPSPLFLPLQAGAPCKMPVNLAKCAYCPYHAQVGVGGAGAGKQPEALCLPRNQASSHASLITSHL